MSGTCTVTTVELDSSDSRLGGGRGERHAGRADAVGKGEDSVEDRLVDSPGARHHAGSGIPLVSSLDGLHVLIADPSTFSYQYLGPRMWSKMWYRCLMHYRVEVDHRAAKQLVKLPRQEQRRVQERIDELAVNPRPEGCVKLTGTRNGYRIRSGDYRIVYTVDDGVRVVSVTRVAHRREVYR